MPSEFRLVGKHTLVYGVGALLGSLTGFLMLPVYTRFLTPADYGVLELLGMTIDVIAMIAGVGLSAALFRFHATTDHPAEKQEIVGTVAFGATGLALATSLSGLVLADAVSAVVFQAPDYAGYLRVFFIIYFFQAAGGPGLLLLRIQERSTAFVAFNLVKLLCSLSLNIYLVVFRQMGLEGVLLSSVLVNAAGALLLSGYTFRYAGLSFSWPRFRAMARFGAPLIVVSLGSFILTFSDRYFLNYFAGTSSVGVYSLAYRFTFVLSTLAVVPFQQVWDPRRFEVAKLPDAQDIFSRMFFYLSLFMLAGAAMMIAVIDDVVRIMAAPAFHSASRLVPVILIATVLQQWASYCALGLFLRDRTDLLARATLVAVVVALVLNAVLIPRWGATGAAWATVAAYSVRFLVVYLASQKAYRIDYPWARVVATCLIAAGVYGARVVAGPISLGPSVAFGGLLASATLVASYRLLSLGERDAVREAAAQAIRRVRAGRAAAAG